MSLRLAPLSNTERQSVIASLACGVRLDGRGLLENRDISIQFGQDFGCCTVSLGDTRVLAQVSCEVVEPRPSRPSEGKIVTSVHISPMAGPEYEAGRTSDIQDELQQLLESNIRESRCLDLEALCIMAEDSVWQLRVDVTVLNACGNLCDACNMAVVAGLKHFHRPDVTVQEDGRVTIHSFAERAPLPTFLKKIPVCLTYAFCEQPDEGELVVFSDPTDLEERVVRGRLVVGLNPHGEITSMNFPGLVMLEKKHITFCISNAFQRARDCAALVDRLVQEDLTQRSSSVLPTRGFVGKLISDEESKRGYYEGRVLLNKTVTSQLRRVRDLVGMKHEGEEGGGDPMEEEEMGEDGTPKEEEDTSSSSSTSSSDSEFSDEDQNTTVADIQTKHKQQMDSKGRQQKQTTNVEKTIESDDSEEEVQEKVQLSSL